MENVFNSVIEVIHNHANAINEKKLNRILSSYSDDGLFMPDGYKTLHKNQIGKSKVNFPGYTDFKIQFGDLKIVINENYAFIETSAKTSENKICRDFFVLRKEESDWKIFRHSFNNLEFDNSHH